MRHVRKKMCQSVQLGIISTTLKTSQGQLLSFIYSNPTMGLGKVYGLIRGDREKEDYVFVHLFHMAPPLQLPESQPYPAWQTCRTGVECLGKGTVALCWKMSGLKVKQPLRNNWFNCMQMSLFTDKEVLCCGLELNLIHMTLSVWAIGDRPAQNGKMATG